jgi:signal transduction histidine kinase
MSSEPEGRKRTPLSRLPIRLRLATAVALVAFSVLTATAIVVGGLTAHHLRSDFNDQLTAQAPKIAANIHQDYNTGRWHSYVSLGGGVANVWQPGASAPLATSNANANLGPPDADGIVHVDGYYVVTVPMFGQLLLQYGLPDSQLTGEIGDLELFLALGVIAGTVLAFGAGSVVARRAITPIAELTAAAAEIERTRDPNRTLPTPTADDEVAELTRTLEGMLGSLSAARNETEATLERQRAFVADASHELRTPLTSVLANLELLVDSLDGADQEIAQSALRSTQRMRRLVGDLLLLARADAHRVPVRAPLDLADVVIEAASELEPAAHDHTIMLDVQPAPTLGSRDDLQRVATNLIENAIRHTPAGTHVIASTRTLPDGSAELVVADDGPGIAADIRDRLFERFARGGGDRGGSFGLGLAIVAAVTEAHGGSVTVDQSPHGGARFTVQLPPAEPVDDVQPRPGSDATVQAAEPEHDVPPQ